MLHTIFHFQGMNKSFRCPHQHAMNLWPLTSTAHLRPSPPARHCTAAAAAAAAVTAARSPRKPPKILRSHRRSKLPHTPTLHLAQPPQLSTDSHLIPLPRETNNSDTTDPSEWTPEELEAISALFARPTPQKPASPQPRPRPLPLPLPYKTRPPTLPTPKRYHPRPTRSSFTDQVRKNPEALIAIAREISALPPESDAREVLDGMSWDRFLRKGSLSMVIRELGHMGLPDRALQTLCWAQTHRPHLFPDDRSLASAVEVLARSGKLKAECQLEEYVNSASRTVVEAMARGFIRAGHLHRARKLLLIVKDSKRMLDASIHAKLIHEAAKTPDGYRLASALLDELAEREESELKLNPQDCTMLMKVCIKLGRFEAVENLFRWYKASGREASIVMYTTVLHGRYRGGEYREGMALVWEMVGMDCLFDLPAYRVVIRLCIASGDFARAGRYFSRMKEAGFTPTYDVYRDMMEGYARTGRWAKCRQICKEVEAAGMKLDGETALLVTKKQGEAG